MLFLFQTRIQNLVLGIEQVVGLVSIINLHDNQVYLVFTRRLFIKVRYTGSAPMNGISRLHSNVHSLNCFLAEDYVTKWLVRERRMIFVCQLLKVEKILPPPGINSVVTSSSANKELFQMTIFSVHCYEDDISRTLEHIQHI